MKVECHSGKLGGEVSQLPTVQYRVISKWAGYDVFEWFRHKGVALRKERWCMPFRWRQSKVIPLRSIYSSLGSSTVKSLVLDLQIGLLCQHLCLQATLSLTNISLTRFNNGKSTIHLVSEFAQLVIYNARYIFLAVDLQFVWVKIYLLVLQEYFAIILMFDLLIFL